MVLRGNRKDLPTNPLLPCATRLQLSPEIAFTALHWQDFVSALRTFDNLSVTDLDNIQQEFLSSLYISRQFHPQHQDEFSQAVMAFSYRMHTYPPCPRLSIRLSSRFCPLSRALSTPIVEIAKPGSEEP